MSMTKRLKISIHTILHTYKHDNSQFLKIYKPPLKIRELKNISFEVSNSQFEVIFLANFVNHYTPKQVYALSKLSIFYPRNQT